MCIYEQKFVTGKLIDDSALNQSVQENWFLMAICAN